MAKKISLPKIVVFEWDQGNLEHIKKHSVTHNECEDVFYNEPIFFEDKKHSEKEERFLAYGLTNEQRLLTVVFTIRDTKLRVISAQNQNKKEKLTYQTHKNTTGGDK